MIKPLLRECRKIGRKCLSTLKEEPVSSFVSAAAGSILAVGFMPFFHYFLISFATMVDVWTGFVAAKRKGIDTSNGLKQKSVDILVYWSVMTIPMLLSFVEPTLFILSWAVTGFFLWVEGKSVVENMNKAGYRVKYLDKLLAILESWLQRILEVISFKNQ